MSEPRRILDGAIDGDALGADLLRAAIAEGPSAHARGRTLAAVGAGVGLTAAAGTVTAATRAASGAALKWLGGGLFATVVASGAIYTEISSHEPPHATTSTTATVNAAPFVASAPVVAPAPTTEERVSGAVSTSAPTAIKRKAAPSLADEVASLDHARELVASGDASNALKALDAHAQTFPSGALVPEARVLRIEVLMKRGDDAAALREAERFLKAFPASPQTRRVQSMRATLRGEDDSVINR